MTYNSHYYIIGHLSTVVKPGRCPHRKQRRCREGIDVLCIRKSRWNRGFCAVERRYDGSPPDGNGRKELCGLCGACQVCSILSLEEIILYLEYHVEIYFSGYIPLGSFSDVRSCGEKAEKSTGTCRVCNNSRARSDKARRYETLYHGYQSG